MSAEGAVTVVTLNRPEVRNAINAALARGLTGALREANSSGEVAVVILTGAGPAFCAGLDLKELSVRGLDAGTPADGSGNWFGALREMTKPVIGAINGPAVTGGLEMALCCDFLIASGKAYFADTHARVGAMPGGGMTGLLPQAVGIRKAKELSFTGNFLDAKTALAFGLVNHVVGHDDLLPFTKKLAAEIASNDQEIVTRLKKGYDLGALSTLEEALAIERKGFLEYRLPASRVESRRREVIERGRKQTRPG